MDKKLINIVKGDINTAILNGSYNRNTAYQTNIEFNTPTKLILLDGDPYSNPSLTKVTWQELKDLRDNNKLVAGSLYRITDYQCTTTQENTRSAGHQFDIVLLALSENKLAEEGWAMMHDNIYDITFNDGVTKKCYLYELEFEYSIVDCATLLGIQAPGSDFDSIDETTKTATTTTYNSTELVDENLPYNYFQNSNLSAWKVWYCLDNDKDRFAWADDSVTKDLIKAYNNSHSVEDYCWRRPNGDRTIEGVNYYYWADDDFNPTVLVFTTTETPTTNDKFYWFNGPLNPPIEGGNILDVKQGGEVVGRGVIYRLIDEFNNDIKYDFKNIQFKRTIINGQYDENGTETWCYTLNLWYNDMCQDASIIGNTLPNDEGFVTGVYDNKFGYATAFDLYIEGVNTFVSALGNNVVLSFNDDGYYGIYSNTIGNEFHNNTIWNNFQNNTIGNYFRNNTIVNTFNSNTIGNNFQDKQISTAFQYTNYGNNGVELATKDDLSERQN